MNHKDHVDLIRKGLPHEKGIWADLGSGDGAFTLALAELLDSQSEIYSVEKDQERILIQQELFQEMFPSRNVHFLNEDFMKPLALPPLDGILMANVLHSVREQTLFLETVRTRLKTNGRLIIVDYNVDEGSLWAPYPLSFQRLQHIAKEAGFHEVELLRVVPSRLLKEMYAAGVFKT